MTQLRFHTSGMCFNPLLHDMNSVALRRNTENLPWRALWANRCCGLGVLDAPIPMGRLQTISFCSGLLVHDGLNYGVLFWLFFFGDIALEIKHLSLVVICHLPTEGIARAVRLRRDHCDQVLP
jgi:hypothetical protein